MKKSTIIALMASVLLTVNTPAALAAQVSAEASTAVAYDPKGSEISRQTMRTAGEDTPTSTLSSGRWWCPKCRSS